jgi:hypothetical protein
MDGMQGRERLAQFVPGDLVFIEVQPVEDGLVEQPLLVLVAAAVERLGVLEQGQAEFDQASVVGEVFSFLAESFCEVATLAFDAAQPLLDFGLWERIIGVQIEQVVSFTSRAWSSDWSCCLSSRADRWRLERAAATWVRVCSMNCRLNRTAP